MKICFSILFSLIVFTAFSQVPDSLKFQSVGPEDFLTLIRYRENAILIDVRMPVEFRSERIENSINIPAAKTGKKNRVPEDRQSVILVYCTTGFRSQRVAPRYYDLGFQKVYNLEGGIVAWKEKGLPVTGKRGAKGR